jgi:hypothetical protein
VLLSPDLPNGPWTAQLTLESGLLHHTATATIQFPATAGTTNQPQDAEGINWYPISLLILGLLLAGFTPPWRIRIRQK